MEGDALAIIFGNILSLLKNEDDPVLFWKKVLETAGEQSFSLRNMDINADIDNIAEQVRNILKLEPIPANLTFLYFGLYDILDSDGEEKPGFYLAGGQANSPESALDNGDLSFFPDNRLLQSATLNAIYRILQQKPERTEVLKYAVAFGAAGIIAKNTSVSLGLKIPVYVGFDSGDYALVSV